MRGFLIFLGVVCLSTSRLQATEFDIDTSKPAACELSSTQQNRIAVRESRVSKVICLNPGVAVDMEPESGQAFVYLSEPVEEPVTLSCVTDGGFVQDLIVTFSPGASQVVVLSEPVDRDIELTVSDNRSDQVVEVIKAIFPGGCQVAMPFDSRIGQRFAPRVLWLSEIRASCAALMRGSWYLS